MNFDIFFAVNGSCARENPLQFELTRQNPEFRTAMPWPKKCSAWINVAEPQIGRNTKQVILKLSFARPDAQNWVRDRSSAPAQIFCVEFPDAEFSGPAHHRSCRYKKEYPDPSRVGPSVSIWFYPFVAPLPGNGSVNHGV